MKFTAIFRRRSTLTDDISSLHKALLGSVNKLEGVWSFDIKGSPEIQKGELVSVCKIIGNKRLKGEVCYALRSDTYLRDESQYDDSISIELSCSAEELESFYNKVFTKLIQVFSAYRAEIVVPSLARNDWRAIAKATREAGRDIYGRYGVYRIWPVSYYCKALLPESFKTELASQFEKGLIFNKPSTYFTNEYELFSGKVLSS